MSRARQNHIEAEAKLTEMYQAWCAAEGLPQLSADEHDHDTLTERQSKWIRAFEAMWDSNDPFDRDNQEGVI